MGNSQWNYIAIGNFCKCSAAEMSIQKYDKLVVDETGNHQEWLLAINLRTGCKGFVPSKFVAPKDSLESKDWYFKDCTRLDAELLLEYIENEPGTFLIRGSESVPNQLALSFLCEKANNERKVSHHLIRRTRESHFYISKNAAFATLDDLINYYSSHSENLKSENLHNEVPKLTKPCRKEMGVPGVQGVWEECRENIQLMLKIGTGTYGDVYKGIWRKNYVVAVKVVKKGANTEAIKNLLLDEANKMKDLKHNHIVKLWCICTINDPIIVTELMHNGSLLNYLKNDKGKKINFKHIIIFALHIASGMNYLSSKKYVHCDLAARNVLVNERNIAKVSDFGLTQKVNDNDTVELDNKYDNKLPIKWTAPEVILTDDDNKRYYQLKSDVWSYGVLLYELITYGETPYLGMSPIDVRREVICGNYRMPKPNGICTDAYYGIMKECWKQDPHSRPDFKSLYSTFENYEFTN